MVSNLRGSRSIVIVLIESNELDTKNSNIGAGDLATGPFMTGLSEDEQYYFVRTHTELTSMYNTIKLH